MGMRIKDLIGQRFGKLVVLRRVKRIGVSRASRWLCRCDCGRETITRGPSLRSGETKTCGCRRLIDLTDKRFGRLLVIGRIDQSIAPRIREPYWHCLCDCGTEKICSSNNLISGRTRSCGCYQRELPPIRLRHGCARKGKVSKTWLTWQRIKTRCFDSNDHSYPYYGARGITMCSGWKNSFESFIEDMGETPAGRSIDRIDNDDGYHCGHCDECIANRWKTNCRWATPLEQGRNKRNNRYVTIRDERRLIIEWAERFGIAYRLVMGRIYRGATPEEALLRHG